MDRIGRLKRRTSWQRAFARLFRAEARRLRAWGHKAYEAPIGYIIWLDGILITCGSGGHSGSAPGVRICSRSDAASVLAALRSQEPLDRRVDRWGWGEGLERLSTAMVAAIGCEPPERPLLTQILDSWICDHA